jgi:methyltransferase-like protein/protein-L-isoaspartate O-methyltransferase
MSEQPQFHSYDDVPYPDLCYAYTHPSRLAAIATLLGMQPPPVTRCRVLELGCASGGNLLPMAYGLPESQFVGIDLSARQIAAGQQMAAALGLTNLTLHALDVRAIPPDFGQFDYIIAHGLYAWVPPAVQDSILTICQRHLAPQGVAYISYNTLPGWHMILMVREMMLYHTRYLTDPDDQASAARAFIRQLSTAIPNPEQSAYAAFLQTYANMRFGQLANLEKWENAALLHDELSDINTPLYFHEFAAQAEQHGLQYLAEADFPQVMMHDLSDEAVNLLRQIAHSTIELEQYLDFLRHQTFRRTLLCHASIDVDRTLRAERVQHLYFASRARLRQDAEGAAYFETPDGSTYPAEDPLTTAALRYLSNISPQAAAFVPLLRAAGAQSGLEVTPEAAQQVAVNLLEAFTYSMQLIELMTYEPKLTPTPSARPQASRLARLQAQTVPMVSNLRHEQVELDGLALAVLPLLDGQHDRAALLAKLLALVESGQLNPSQPDATPEQIRRQLAHDLDVALNWLGHAALLES